MPGTVRSGFGGIRNTTQSETLTGQYLFVKFSLIRPKKSRRHPQQAPAASCINSQDQITSFIAVM